MEFNFAGEAMDKDEAGLLSRQTTDHYTRLVSVIRQRGIDALRREVRGVEMNLTRRGLYASSLHFDQLDELGAARVASCASDVYEAVLAAAETERGQGFMRCAQLDLMLRHALEGVETLLTQVLEQLSAPPRRLLSNPPPFEPWRTRAAMREANAKYAALLHFSVNRQSNQHSAMSHINVSHSPGAVVQTGHQSSATVHQTIAMPVPTEEVRQAIAALVDAVRTAHLRPDQRPELRDEVVEILGDLEQEASKAKPNKARVATLIGGLVTFIQTIPNVEQTWDKLVQWGSAVAAAVSA